MSRVNPHATHISWGKKSTNVFWFVILLKTQRWLVRHCFLYFSYFKTSLAQSGRWRQQIFLHLCTEPFMADKNGHGPLRRRRGTRWDSPDPQPEKPDFQLMTQNMKRANFWAAAAAPCKFMLVKSKALVSGNKIKSTHSFTLESCFAFLRNYKIPRLSAKLPSLVAPFTAL